jgi:uncharacterized protein YecE (DUF72 family)
MSEQDQLQDQIKYLDSRLAEIEAKVAQLPASGDYQRQELLDEASTLAGVRRACDQKLRVLLGTDDDKERARREQNRKRVEQLRQARVESYRRGCEEQARELERQGDFRNARLHRLESLNAYKVAQHEIHD